MANGWVPSVLGPSDLGGIGLELWWTKALNAQRSEANSWEISKRSRQVPASPCGLPTQSPCVPASSKAERQAPFLVGPSTTTPADGLLSEMPSFRSDSFTSGLVSKSGWGGEREDQTHVVNKGREELPKTGQSTD